MAEDGNAHGLNILCIGQSELVGSAEGAIGTYPVSEDGGGVRGLSALLVLNEIMRRVNGTEGGDDVPLYPADYFDVIAGSGTGGVSACMLGRLHMPMNRAIPAYVKLMDRVLADKKIIGMSGPSAYKGTTLREELKSLIRDATGADDQRMREDGGKQDGCKTMVFAMSRQNIDANHPAIFRTYQCAENSTPNCTIWEALYATMAHPSLFKSIEIEEHSIKHSYVGGDLGCSNPIAQVLAEVKRLYPGRYVSCIVSIGTGHLSAIQVPTPSLSQCLHPSEVAIATRNMAADSEGQAEVMKARFQDVSGLYYRFNVGQGYQRINVGDWERLSDVVAHTQSYTEHVDTSREVDLAVQAIKARKTTISAAHVDGRIHASLSQQALGLWRCPAPTDMFTGREAEILQIGNCILGCADERRVCVLHGLGGAGKTQLALKAIDRHRGNWKHVVYLDASSKEAIETSLQGFAKVSKIGESHEDALEWLELLREPWLMFFDNADHPSLEIKEYFPGSSRGSILITTRLVDLEVQAQGPGSVCHVSGMSPQDALALLLKVAGKQDVELVDDETRAANALLQDFGHLALAIVHAGAYIRNRHTSISQYRERFISQRRSVLEQSSKLDSKVGKYQKSVYTTWRMCYGLLDQDGRSRRLLWLLAFLHHNGITEQMFERAAIHIQAYEPVLPSGLEVIASDYMKQYLGGFLDSSKQWDTLPFSEVINELASYSLIEFDRVNSAYSIHVLVQEWARTVIPQQLDFALECATTLISQSVGRDNTVESINFRIKLRLHVNNVLTEHCDKVAHNHGPSFALVFRENGQWNRAQDVEEYVKEVKTQLLGAEHPVTLITVHNPACTYGGLGRFDDAEALLVLMLDMLNRLLGEEDPVILTSAANLAYIYQLQGRWADAERLDKQALETRKRILGEEHPSTLIGISNLACNLSDQGQWDEAEKLQMQVLHAHKRILGEEHPLTLLSMNNLASTYSQQGRWRDAEALYEQVLDAFKRTRGEEHPDTLLSMSNLAASNSKQGCLGDIARLEEEVMNVNKQILGEGHPNTINAANNLAYTYQAQCRWKDAEALLVEALNVSKRVLGKEHHKTITLMNNLAQTYYSQQGLQDDAERLQVKVIEISKRILGEEHPDTLTCMGNLACTYQKQGRWGDAAVLQTDILTVSKRSRGEKHPDTLLIMNNLASIHQLQGNWEDAQKLQLHVLNVFKETLGEEHSLTLTSMNNLAHTYSNQGRWGDAETLQVQILDISKRNLGEKHPDTLLRMNNLAGTYLGQSRWDEAEAMLARILDISQQILGEEDPLTLTCMNNLAVTHSEQGRSEDAETLRVQVLNTRKRILGEKHPDTLTSLNNLACTYVNQGRWAEAESLLVQAVTAWDQMAGSERAPKAVLAREGLEALRRHLSSNSETSHGTEAERQQPSTSFAAALPQDLVA